MKTLFILMDSLNRHYLNLYGQGWVKTPNLDRLAARGAVFENHYCGSLPCMPARREILTGRLNFLEAPWGPIEPWDDCLPKELRRQKQTYSHMITDHYHYFHSGGEAYHTLFDSYEFERGQEGDAWIPQIETPKPPPGYRGKGALRAAYWRNRNAMDPESDLAYPTPRCFQRAIEFLDRNHATDNWHLHLEVFDPHEPFDCPTRYRELYDDDWEGVHFTWPPYDRLDPRLDDAKAVAHIRKCYAGSLTMADHWLGKLLDKMDEHRVWDDTMVILTTDHGHLLGEHGYWAKNYMFDYQELAHIPLIAVGPGVKAGARVKALTATMDLMPTIMDLFGADLPVHVHGKSLTHLFAGEGSHHDAVLFGYFGKDVNLVDGRYSYCRQPIPGSLVHHHTAMPRGFSDFTSREKLAAAELGAFLPTTHGIPHFRMAGKSHRHIDATEGNPIFDLVADPGQTKLVCDTALERKLEAVLVAKLRALDAPACQYTRLGLAP